MHLAMLDDFELDLHPHRAQLVAKALVIQQVMATLGGHQLERETVRIASFGQERCGFLKVIGVIQAQSRHLFAL
jgi:hypothetical protein